MSDNIFALPSDKIPSTREENEMLDWLFPQKPKENITPNETEKIEIKNDQVINKVEEKQKSKISWISLLFIFGLFFGLNLDMTNTLLGKLIKTENQYIISGIKTTLLIIIVFLFALIIKRK